MPGVATTPAAYIQYDLGAGSKLPFFVTTDKDWSVAMWIRPDVGSANRSIIQLSDHNAPDRSAIHIGTTNGGQDVRVDIYDAAGDVIASSTTVDSLGPVRPISTAFESWTLVIVTHDAVNSILSDLSVVAINASGDLFNSRNSTYNPATRALAPFDRVRIGKAALPGSAGMVGTYGPVVVRAHATKTADASGLWAARSIGGLVAYEGGTWNSDPGAIWGVFHAMCSHPFDQDGGLGAPGMPPEFSIASSITPSNCCIFDRGMTDAGWLDVHSLRTQVAGAWSFVSPDDFFPLSAPMYPGVPPAHSVRGRARVLSLLAHGLDDGLRRVLVTGNSRATRFIADARPELGAWPQTWGAGLALASLERVCGSFAVYPVTTLGVAEFGADWTTEPRASFRANSIANDRALRRFSYGSQKNGEVLPNGDSTGGPGGGVVVRPGGFYQTLTHQVPGSRYLWEFERVYGALVLAYPGSVGAEITLRSSAASENDPGAIDRALGTRIPLDTTRVTSTVVTSNALLRTLTIAGTGHAIQPGEAVSTFNSPTTWDVSIVESVSEGPTDTTLTLEHWFDPSIAVSIGRTVRVGSWDLRWLRVVCPAGESWATDTWQGFRVTTSGAEPGPVCILTEEWFANTDGYLFGSVGWSAHGYDLQLQSAFTTPRQSDGISPFQAFLRAIAPDSVLVTPAQQSEAAATLGPYTQSLRAALGPDIEIVWVADQAHGRSTRLSLAYSWFDQDYSSWYTWMASNARTSGVAFIAGGIASQGSFADQYGRGWRSDSVSHSTSEGNLVWARAVLKDARLLLPIPIHAPTLPRAGRVLSPSPE